MEIEGTVLFDDFSGGMNVATSEYHLVRNQYRGGSNIYLTKYGDVWIRKGKELHNVSALGSAVDTLERIYIGASTGFVAGAGTVLYSDNALSGTWTSLKTGLTGNVIRSCDFPGYGQWFFCDGTNMLKYDLTNVRNWGIAAPTVAPTAATVGAGGAFPVIIGYTYAYTYYNSATTHESEYKTGTSTGPDPTADYVQVGVTASTDPQVTNIKVYRTYDGGDSYYYHSTRANTTGTFNDTTADTSLGATYGCEGNGVPSAGKDCCIIHNRVAIAGANMQVQISQNGEPESFPGANYGYTFTEEYGPGVDIVRITPFQMGNVNALLIFKDVSLTAVYGLEYEDPADWEFRVVSKKIGLLAADSLVEGDTTQYWVALRDGVVKVYQFGSIGRGVISTNIEPLLNVASVTYMANSVAWFYDGKYFLSYPSESDSTLNDKTMFYDVRTQSWHPYSDWGVNSAAVFNGSGDTGQVYVGDTASGYVDRIEYPDTYADRGDSYRLNLKTRWGDGGNPARNRKFWLMTAECWGNDFDIIVKSERGFSSNHRCDEDTTDIWVGGWIGGWSSSRNKIADAQKLAQGITGRYVTMEFTSDNPSANCAIIMGVVDYEIETDT